MSVQTSFFIFIRLAHRPRPRSQKSTSVLVHLPIHLSIHSRFEQDRRIVIDRGGTHSRFWPWHAAVAIILWTFSLISRAHPQEVGAERREDEWQAECTPRGMGKRRREQPRDPTVAACSILRPAPFLLARSSYS